MDFRDNRMRLRIGVAGGIAFSLLVPVLLFFTTVGRGDDGWLYVGGRLAGLVGLAVCLLQPVGMTAAGVWCFGAKKMQFHKTSGITGLSLLFLHPVLFAADEWDLWVFGLDVPWAIQLGKIALLLMVVAAGSFFLIRFKLLKFPLFSKIHLLAYPAALLGLIHAFYAGTSLRASPLLLAYYILLAAGGTAAFVGLRIRRIREARLKVKRA